MRNHKSNSILFITGAFMSNSSWDNWKDYFEGKGYTTFAPAWPYKDAPAEVLRNRQPNQDIASIRLDELTEYYVNIILKMDEEPILVGHSLGGLIVQLLLQRKFGTAGVAIHSVPPLGIIPFELSFFRSALKPLGLFTSAKKSHLMSFPEWQYAIANGMDVDTQKETYQHYATPESKLILRDTLGSAAKIDFKKSHVPLLFIAGDEDHIMPASVNYSNYKKYINGNKNAITDYMEFEGRNHFVLGQRTWKEEASYIDGWLEKHNIKNLTPVSA